MTNNTNNNASDCEELAQQSTLLKNKNSRLIIKLFLAIGLMFGFGFALVPLYDVFCQITGINGRLVNNNSEQSDFVDESRIVRLQFTTSIAPGMPWQFQPKVRYVDVHPGQNTVVHFVATNNSKAPVIGQAIPSVTPGIASLYLNKTECFCFQQQKLNNGEQVEMGLVFFISPEIPNDITTLTLSYTLFNVTQSVSALANDKARAL